MHLSLLIWRWGKYWAKARDLTKEVGPWWGLLIIAKSQDRDFWISSDYRCHLGLEDVKDLVTSWLTAALPGRLVLNQRWQLGSVGIFYTHVHDGGWGERDMVHTVSINNLLSILIQMNTSIQPWGRAFDPKIASSSNPRPLTSLPSPSTLPLIGASY